ncbi:hypothetical protein F4778DRAFT_554146 [Xylariomycetidae sp. FL2044]|nr:hypothetical protein F4778DRAFT_554146 [Xylariomycetidae sp. FL2044]
MLSQLLTYVLLGLSGLGVTHFDLVGRVVQSTMRSLLLFVLMYVRGRDDEGDSDVYKCFVWENLALDQFLDVRHSGNAGAGIGKGRRQH